MTSTTIVLHVLLVEGVLVVLAFVAVFGHALWYRRASATRAAQLEASRGPLITALASGDAVTDMHVLHAMPQRVLVRLLTDIAPSLAGPSRDTVVELAMRLGLTDAATGWLSSRLWWRRLHGARLLTAVAPDAQLLEGLGSDPHPLVRAQRAEVLGHHPTAAGGDELVALLADRDATVRFAVRESLMRLGTIAQEPIVRCLELRDPANLLDLLDIAAAIPTTDFHAVALTHSRSEQPAVRERAARLLRAIGGGDSVDRLVALLADPHPAVRATAASALGTLGHWPAATVLARLLGDAEWDVRLAAAVAMQRLGAPGELLLRRARDGDAGVASDVARHVLDVADRMRVALRA